MTREELLKSREYWIIQIQNKLYQLLEKYRAQKKLTKAGLANELGVTKGYISQVLNGDFDHKISKLVDLSLACNMVPFFQYIPLKEFVERDKYCAEGESVSLGRPVNYFIYSEGSQPVNINSGELKASAYFSLPPEETIASLYSTSVSTTE